MCRRQWWVGLVVLGVGCVAALVGSHPTAVKADPPTFANAKGYAVHIACETVDADHYGEGVPDLPATLKDRDSMAALSKKLGYEHLAVLSAKDPKKENRTTRENVLKALNAAAARAKGENGDIVLVTYSGHGGQVPDDDDDADEVDGLDQTWCLYDGMLVDDEVGMLLKTFQKGVRVVFVFDSCHSETAAKGLKLNAQNFKSIAVERVKQPNAKPKVIIEATPGLRGKMGYASDKGGGSGADSPPPPRGSGGSGAREKVVVRALPREAALAVYAKHEAFYKNLATKSNKDEVIRDPRKLNPSVITLAACRDSQTALDAGAHGLYTRELLKIWADGAFDKDYNEFQKQVKEVVFAKAQDPKFADEDGTPHRQEPQLTFSGAVPTFADQKLLRIK